MIDHLSEIFGEIAFCGKKCDFQSRKTKFIYVAQLLKETQKCRKYLNIEKQN